mgnify:CR=1 FL=1
MSNKLILRLSNEIGNQMFMYASSLGISKKLNRSLLIDNETAYLLKKNISKYGLNNFTITSKIAPNNYKFLGVSGYIKRKFLKKIDIFRTNKNFFIEYKDKDKLTYYNSEIFTKNFSNTVLLGKILNTIRAFALYLYCSLKFE